MSNEIIVHLEGLEAFQRALLQIPPKVAAKVLRASAAAGARVVRAGVRAEAPVGSYSVKSRGRGKVTPAGVLKRAIVNKFAREKTTPTSATYVVAVRKGKGKGKGASAGDAYYARWVEEGHKIVPRRSSGGGSLRSRRKVASAGGARTRPRPFFRPGTTATGAAALQAMQQRMAQELVKVL